MPSISNFSPYKYFSPSGKIPVDAHISEFIKFRKISLTLLLYSEQQVAAAYGHQPKQISMQGTEDPGRREAEPGMPHQRCKRQRYAG